MPLMAEEIFDDVLKYESIQEEIALEQKNILHMLGEEKENFIENARGELAQDKPEDENTFEYSNERLYKVKQTLENFSKELEDIFYEINKTLYYQNNIN